MISNLETYRIVESGKYCIDEDIKFNPLPGDITQPNNHDKVNWFPRDPSKFPGCDTNTNGAYALGFFAAITIETSNVELDLENKEIKQHQSHYFQQRFFSIIEIGKAPFIKGSGPTNFGKISTVKNVYIHNGKLGLSAHHGIHSNNAKKITIEDLKIFDFEVAGIQFNGFRDLTLRNLEIGPSANDVKGILYIVICFIFIFIFMFSDIFNVSEIDNYIT